MQKAIISGVRPTRLELLRLRRRELIARKGRDILQEKLDALVLENTKLNLELEKMAGTIREQMVQADEALRMAGVLSGWVHLSEIASACQKIPEISVSGSQVMGVRVPHVTSKSSDGDTGHRKTWGYSVNGTLGQVDEASMLFEILLSLLLDYASVQGRADRILLEMNRTRRRVNALDHLVIPRLQGTMRYIEFRLEEREREDLFRRKRMKQIMERKSEPGEI